MKEIIDLLTIAVLLGTALVFLKWVEKTVILPQKNAYAKAKAKKKVNPRRMCSEHIVCLSVPGSMAVLDEQNCYLCIRRKEEKQNEKKS